MKILITEQQYKIYDSLSNDKNLILYHGTDVEHTFHKRGDFQNGTFLSLTQEFAETWGKYIYEIRIKPGLKIFDSWNPNHVKELLNNVKDIKNSFALDDEGEVDENEYNVTRVDQIVNNRDNWIIIEDNPQIIKWIQPRYDGIWIWEDEQNLLLFTPINAKIISSKLIKSNNTYDRVKYN
jgi:hypothetical protein